MKAMTILGIFALMMLLVIPGAVSAADVQVSGSVVDEDLTVTALAINPGSSSGHDVICANEANTLRATVANLGGLDAGAFDVTIVIGAYTQAVRVTSLAAGATTTVDFTGFAPTIIGDMTVVVTADSSSEIEESDETNNVLSQIKTVFYNGYKGKRYTAGNDFTTVDTYMGRVGVVYSNGNAAYASAGWTSYSASFTAGTSSADLVIPSGATILSARLYQSTNWDESTGGAGAIWSSVQFNAGEVTPTASYTDRKGYGGYNFPSYVYMYDVTSTFNKAGTNTWALTPGTGNKQALYPTYIVVVFQDPATQTEKTIYINDECDLLYSRASYNTNDAEATAYALFSGVDTTGMGSAKAIAFVAAVNEDGQSQFIFNNVDQDDFYISSAASTAQTVSIKEFTLSNVVAGANEAKFQSRDAIDGDNMQAQNVILVIEKSETTVTADFTPATQVSGDKPYTVNFDSSASTGYITGYAWTFGDGATSTEQSPTHTYTARGTYDVSLMVAGLSSSDTETKTALVVVKEPAPAVDFSADDTTPLVGQTVTFTATNTGGQVDSWLWNFGDGQTSTLQNPTHVYATEGTFTVSLTTTGPDYSDSETKNNYIQVGAAVIDVSVTPASIDFGTMSAGVDETGSTTVTVDVTAGTTWSVTAAANNGGYMSTGTVNLANPFQLSNDGTNFQAMTSNFANFMTGAAGVDGSDTADVKQAIAAADAPGAYSITLTFTGGFA
jgi:PKD repeat protein